MQRKVLSFLLAGLLVLSLFTAGVPRVSAAQDMRASDACVELIKSFEGFSATVFYDYLQYSIGYGTACGKNDYPNGITQEAAEQLLRRDLAKFETSINQFAARYGLNLSQQQFDALASFTYNLGPNWMNNASTFRSAVLDGTRGNDFLFAITQWSNAGGVIQSGLVNRRMAEANLYLNGEYSKNLPSGYRYVLFDNNLTGAVSTIKIQGYDAGTTDAPRANPTKSGYKFIGWYTQPNGGTRITQLDANTPKTLYAHWEDASGESVSDNSQGHEVHYKVTVIADDVNIRTGPGTNYAKNGKAQKGQQIQLTWIQSGGQFLWGRFDKGWICLDYTDYEIVLLETAPEAGVVTAVGEIINTDTLRIRARPTTSSDAVGTYQKGEKVNITLQCTVDGNRWGKTDKGWISLNYVKLSTVQSPTEPPTELPTEPPVETPTEPKDEVIATGEIVGCNSLRIRAGAGTKYQQVGSLAGGTRVSLYELTGSGNQKWARIDQGWISMNYVQLVDDTVNDSDDISESNQEPVTGYVVNCDALNIRAGVGTQYSKVGKLPVGTEVTILETRKLGNTLWGRIDKGWVSMDYIQLNADGTDVPVNESGNSGTSDNVTSMTGCVANCDALNVRANAGTKYERVDRLPAGTKVTILETKQQGNTLWGRIDKGWISMDYVRLDGGSLPSGSFVGTVTANALRIRCAPGTSNAEVGMYTRGTQVVILEEKTVGSTVWGRTSKGWISMDYVK